MTEIRCPKCGLMNPLSALQCTHCSLPFSNLPPTAFVETDQCYEGAPGFNKTRQRQYGSSTFGSPPVDRDGNEVGRKTFFWYRVYCGSLTVIYALVAVLGLVLAYFRPDTREYSS